MNDTEDKILGTKNYLLIFSTLNKIYKKLTNLR